MVEKKRWFEQEQNYIEPVSFRHPYENIYLGPSPLDGMRTETAEMFDVFINLSSYPNYIFGEKPKKDAEFYWYPLKEIGFWGYEPFLWSKVVLDESYDKGKNIYLHCEAGVNRSPCIAISWLSSRKHDLEEAVEIVADGKDRMMYYLRKRYQKNIDFGFIPDNLDEFYRRLENYGPDLDGIITEEPKLLEYPGKFMEYVKKVE